jgi:hypothetical protein
MADILFDTVRLVGDRVRFFVRLGDRRFEAWMDSEAMAECAGVQVMARENMADAVLENAERIAIVAERKIRAGLLDNFQSIPIRPGDFS